MAATLQRNSYQMSGCSDGPTMLFAHGFGCDSNMWRFVAPAYEDRFRVITFDHVGHGRSSPAGFDPDRHVLDGYASDVIELCETLGCSAVVFVGHSVSAMIGAIAAVRRPDLFDRLVMVGPSPRYLDDADYVGGFTRSDIDSMLESLDSNYLGWSSTMAPAIVGNPERPELGAELTASFCRTDPAIAKQFARVTFLSDNRGDLDAVRVPTLVVQCRNDIIAPISVGQYVCDHIPDATFRVLDATGHCPNLSAPDETIGVIDEFLGIAR
ncbi:MAG: alpha/beta hydrolase [Ilumatobacteraceae bacterium]